MPTADIASPPVSLSLPGYEVLDQLRVQEERASFTRLDNSVQNGSSH